METTICPQCNKEFRNLAVHTRMAHGAADSHSDSNLDLTTGSGMPPSPDVQLGATVPPKEPQDQNLAQVLGGIVAGLKKIDDRLTSLEVKAGGRDDSFKKGARVEDVHSASSTRLGVDERIVKIVDQTLGEDFGVEVTPRDGQPGLNFTLLVPQRLSEIKVDKRPVKDISGAVEWVEYWPGDKRTRAISSHQSYDAVQEWCERVRSYIVGYYQKLNRPIPEFKLRSYA